MLRRQLLNKCRVRMKMGDDGSYAALLDGLNKIIDAIHPSRYTSGEKRTRASLLKSILKGVADYFETHAVSQRPGLARALYTEMNGHAGLPIFRRFDAALAAAASAAPSPAKPVPAASSAAAPPRRDGGAGRRPGFNRSRDVKQAKDINDVMCYGCRNFGHYRNHCPNRGQDKPSQ